MSRIDVHQHFWPRGLRERLARRSAAAVRAPATATAGACGWTASPTPRSRPRPTIPVLRAEALGARRRGRARSLCMSSPLGVEALPAEEARPLLDAWHDGVLALDGRSASGARSRWTARVPADVDALLDRGAVGLSLPAGALAPPERRRARRPAARGARAPRRARCSCIPAPASRTAWPAAPPGRCRGGRRCRRTSPSCRPPGSAFAAWGRRAHPRLRVALRRARGRRAAARRAHRRARRPGARGRRSARPSTTRRPTAAAPSTRSVARRSASTQLVHGSDRPVVGRARRPRPRAARRPPPCDRQPGAAADGATAPARLEVPA